VCVVGYDTDDAISNVREIEVEHQGIILEPEGDMRSFDMRAPLNDNLSRDYLTLLTRSR